MRFQTRNAFYLRISASTVIPLYLYLDERHVEWMSERVLQHVLADIRPLILPKLNAEADAQLGPGGPANAKRGTLDVHRGDTYQFGYFLRGTEPHAVLIKARTFHAAPKPPPRTAASRPAKPKKAAPAPGAGKKRKPKPRPRGKGKGKAKADEAIAISSEEDRDEDIDPAESLATRRPKRVGKVAAGGYAEDVDEDMDDDFQADSVQAHDHPTTSGPLDAGHDNGQTTGTDQLGQEAPVVHPKLEEAEPSLSDMPPPPPPIDITDTAEADEEAGEASAMDVEFVEDEEESKPKPVLKLSYHGFNIHGRCLCVIVEPYPPLRSGTRAPSLAPMGLVAPRAPSIAPPDFVPSGGAGQRARTPLFLPDFDREPTPAPGPGRTLPPVPLFSETADASDDEENGEMVLFSQLLRSVGDHPPGIAEDDDEIDGAVFFGDADEMREL